MKQVIMHLAKRFAVVLIALVLLTGVVSNAVASSGPGRETRVWSPTVEGFDHVTFNSFTNVGNGIGDERDFLRGYQVGRDSVWTDPVNGVTQDAEVEAQIYIHNNAKPALNDAGGNPGIAKNVTVKVAMPTGTKQSQEVTSYIKAENAQPGEIFDTLSLTGANSGFFELAYKDGSAQIHKNGQVINMTAEQEQAMIHGGVNIGDIKGCFDYVQEITFRMKVKMPEYTIKKQVRHEGQTANDWKESIDVKRGETVEWKVEFNNIGKTQLNSVAVLDELPPFTTVVPGSVKMYDSNYPSGYTFGADAIQKNGKLVGVDLGIFPEGSGATVILKTKINDVKELECGTTKLTNIAYATPKDRSSVSDGADVYVVNDKECNTTTTKNKYECKAIDIKQDARKVTVTVKPNQSGNVKVKSYDYNFGEGEPLTTDKASAKHTYAKDGTYKVNVKVNFSVDGVDKPGVTSDECSRVITIDTVKPTTTKLPNTGAADVAGIFVATTIFGAIVHKLFVARKSSF